MKRNLMYEYNPQSSGWDNLTGTTTLSGKSVAVVKQTYLLFRTGGFQCDSRRLHRSYFRNTGSLLLGMDWLDSSPSAAQSGSPDRDRGATQSSTRRCSSGR